MINLYIVYFFIVFTILLNVKTFISSLQTFSKREKIVYLYLLLSISGWVVCNAGADIIKNPSTAELFARLSILFPINVLNALLQIFRDFPKTIKKSQRYNSFKAINYITFVFSLVSVIFLYSKANISNFEIFEDTPAAFIPGSMYYIIAALSVFIFVFIINFWRKNKDAYTKTQKRQIFSLLGTLTFVMISITLGLIVLPLQGLSIYSPFMFLSLSLLLFIINKSLLIKVAILDIQEELIKLGGLLISSIVLVILISATNIVNLDINWIGRILMGFLLVSIILLINDSFKNIYEKNRRLMRKQVTSFIEESTSKLQTADICQSLIKTLHLILKTKDITIRIINNKEMNNLEKMIEQWWRLRKRTPIINREVLIESYYDIKNNKELSQKIFYNIQAQNIDMIIPISNPKNILGFIYIRNSPKILNETDYKTLELLSNTVSVSISRALIYEEVKELNSSLQQKVDAQTKELKQKVKLLEEARRKENDMIDIMGHELRTPATIVKLNIDFLSKFKEKLPSEKETFEKYINRIKDAVETEIKLINTLLTSAKLVGNKVELNMEKVNVLKEVEMALRAEEQTAQQKGLLLINNIKQDLFAYADSARVAEIFFNLINNAVKYTDKGSITIDGSIEGNYIKVSVKDTGKGIPQKDISKLGSKFFRTQTYIHSKDSDDFNIVRPGGTGLGLYVTFGLAKKMNGKILVDSKEGIGSIFTVYLPKYSKRELSNNNKNNTNDMFKKLGLR